MCLEWFNSPISSTSAVSARVLGPLAAPLSYDSQYESDTPVGRVTTDPIGRAALVYTFQPVPANHAAWSA